MSSNFNGTDSFETGKTICAFHASLEISVGQTLGVIQQACEPSGLAAAIGNLQEVVQPLFHPRVRYKAALCISIETLALSAAAGAGDDVNDVPGTHAGNLLLLVTCRDEINARM